MARDPETPIQREEIEASIRSFVGDVESKAEASAKKMLPIAIGGGVIILIIAYLLGKRVGTTKSTVVEIRRI